MSINSSKLAVLGMEIIDNRLLNGLFLVTDGFLVMALVHQEQFPNGLRLSNDLIIHVDQRISLFSAISLETYITSFQKHSQVGFMNLWLVLICLFH